MEYEKFKEKLVKRLKEHYGDSAEVEVKEMPKNNSTSYEGLQISPKGAGSRVIPIIKLDELYEDFKRDNRDMDWCVEEVLNDLESNEAPESVKRLVERLNDWNLVKETVYPILLSTDDNKEMLEELVSIPMLDMSVAYIIRMEVKNGSTGSIKITRSMLNHYGISGMQLHNQAMENLEKDGYNFLSLTYLVRNLLTEKEMEEAFTGISRPTEMYVLTNSSKTYGAAGILNKELIRKFAGKQDYFILPSSVHETIFVPVNDRLSKETLDNMVAEVNETQVSVEERLTNHSYFYSAETDEIRMCA